MNLYEITWELANGDWHYYRAEYKDFHEAVTNTLDSWRSMRKTVVLGDARLKSIELIKRGEG